MYYLVVYRTFMIIYGRVGVVTIKNLSQETGMSRSSAHRYMDAMIKAGLVMRVSHGKYEPCPDTPYMDGFYRMATLGELLSFQHAGTSALANIPF